MSNKDLFDDIARRKLLDDLAAGRLGVEEAVAILRRAGFGDVGDGRGRQVARIDHDRARRTGWPEVILCEGKEPADLPAIAGEILSRSDRLLATRASAEHAAALCEARPAAVHHERARCVTIGDHPELTGHVAIVTAGTADVPVAEEARVTAQFLGARVDAFYDVGVAGVHRVLAEAERLARANVVICCAGMEGALPSVVGGLVGVPVIAVPTQGGYGATFGGLAALLAMVNSCAANVCCVGIDDGFGAGHLAAMINAGPDRPGGDRSAAR